MKRTILILRHGKSDWGDGSASDFERPLNKRGRKAAIAIGGCVVEQGFEPQLIISSDANRALSTAEIVIAELGGLDLLPDNRMYLADHDDIYEVLAGISDDVDCAMIVGHNPGLEELVDDLCGSDGIVMKTCTLAVVQISNCSWTDIASVEGALIGLYNPRELMQQA